MESEVVGEGREVRSGGKKKGEGVEEKGEAYLCSALSRATADFERNDYVFKKKFVSKQENMHRYTTHNTVCSLNE